MKTKQPQSPSNDHIFFFDGEKSENKKTHNYSLTDKQANKQTKIMCSCCAWNLLDSLLIMTPKKIKQSNQCRAGVLFKQNSE